MTVRQIQAGAPLSSLTLDDLAPEETPMPAIKAVDLDAIESAVTDTAIVPTSTAATGIARISDRIEGIVKELSAETASQFTSLREQIDHVLKQNEARKQALTDAILEYAQFTQAAIESKLIIADALAQIETRLQNGMPATPRLVKS